MLWKLDGLTDEEVRRPMVPSGTNLVGLVKHLANAEYGWFCETFGRPTEPLTDISEDLEADMRAAEGEATADIVAFYRRAWAAADAAILELPLEATGTAYTGAHGEPALGARAHDRGHRPARRPRRHPARAARRRHRPPRPG